MLKKAGSNQHDDVARARDYAFLLLKFRPRSSAEMSLRLRQKKFSDDAVRRTIEFLAGRKFIDDEAFARAWIRERVQRPLGIRRIKAELSAKGINAGIVERAFAEVCPAYSESGAATRLAREISAKLTVREPGKTRQRVYAQLRRRGFSSEAAEEAVRSAASDEE